MYRLHIAASKGLVKVLDVCIHHSTDVNVRDVNGQFNLFIQIFIYFLNKQQNGLGVAYNMLHKCTIQ